MLLFHKFGKMLFFSCQLFRIVLQFPWNRTLCKEEAVVKQYFVESPSGRELSFDFCGWEKCPPGHRFGPAVRAHYLFHYVIRGSGWYQRGGVRYPLRAGQGFLIFPGESTVYAASETDPWEYSWFSFDGTAVPELLGECGLTPEQPIYTDHSEGQLERRMQRLLRVFETGAPDTCQLLGYLYLCFASMHTSPDAPKGYGEAYARRAAELMDCSYAYDLTVEEVARHVGVDRTYLYRVFCRYWGCSPKEYLTRVRLDAATQLLRNTPLSMTEIAASCGFRELTTLERQFKARTGAAPLAWRKAQQK